MPRPAPPTSHESWTAADWERFLTQKLGGEVQVRLGRSRTVPVEAKREAQLLGRRRWQIRLHRMFQTAPVAVREALAGWLRSGRRARRACSQLDAWIDEQLAAEPAPVRVPQPLRAAGTHHDLELLSTTLYASEFQADFGGSRPRPGLTWGRRGRSQSRRSLRLGSYDLETHIVRIHPVLDQPAVPDWFVRFVLMHEILHAALPPRPGRSGRWVHHGPEFRAREAAYADYQRALSWEEQNLHRLIESARRDKLIRTSRERRAQKPPVEPPVDPPARTRDDAQDWSQGELFGDR